MSEVRNWHLGGPNCKCCNPPGLWEKRRQEAIDKILDAAFAAVRPIVEKELETENVSDIMDLTFASDEQVPNRSLETSDG
jgi:hypothetical protein